MMYDTTPDLGHHEQMSQVFRYVGIDSEKNPPPVEIKEVFLGFIQIHAKSAGYIANCITKKDKLSIHDCRAQCYDNAAVMTGHLSGVQQRI